VNLPKIFNLPKKMAIRARRVQNTAKWANNSGHEIIEFGGDGCNGKT